MRKKLLILGLILTSLVGYLEWGGGNHMFLIEGEIDIIRQMIDRSASILHPLVLLPLAGQVLLLYTLFQKDADKILIFIGIIFIAILFLVILLTGILGAGWKVIVSTIPFLGLSIYTVISLRWTREYTGRDQ